MPPRLRLTIDDLNVECDIPKGVSLASQEFYQHFVKPCLMALQLKLDPTLVTGSIIELRKP